MMTTFGRHRTAVLLVAVVTVLVVGAAGTAVFVGTSVHPAQEAATAVASWAGVRYRGTVTGADGRDTELDLTVAADGSAHGTLRRPFGASAEVGVGPAGSLIKGNREWWVSALGAGEADRLVDRWIANPPAAVTGLEAIDLLAPTSLSRALVAPADEPRTRTGDRRVAGRAAEAWSDGRRQVVLSAGGAPEVLTVDVPLHEDRYALTLPTEPSPDEPGEPDEAGPGDWVSQVEATVAPPTEDEMKELEDFWGEVEELTGALDQLAGAIGEDAEADESPADECRPRDEVDRATGNGDPGSADPPGPAGSPGPPAPDPRLPWQPPPPPPPFVGRPGEVIGARNRDSTGGIDLSGLELRYVRDTGEGIEYAFAGAPGRGPSATRRASDAFFVWLALPPDSFWVNLGPDEPDRIIDPRLGRTDAGRILLEADLEMKKVSARLLNPDTPLGQRFWDSVEMYGDGVCASTRYWITPGTATIAERDGGLFIVDAPLEVHAEAMAVPDAVEVPDECRGVPPSIVRHNESLERDLVRPEIERAVNEAPEFAALRQVYLSRVAAEWFRTRSGGGGTPVDGLIDSQDVSPWISRVPWSPREVFESYLESLRDSELDVVREKQVGTMNEEVRYVVGGVDWSTIAFDALDPEEVRPGLEATLAASFAGPVTDEQGMVWRGSSAELPSSWRGSGWWPSSYVAVPFVVGIVAVGLPAWIRRRRTPSVGPREDAS